MAYIDIETARADFRVIAGGHWKSMNPRQLPSQPTALIMEGIFPKDKAFYSDIEGKAPLSNANFHKEFNKIVERGQKAGILIAMADPIADMEKVIAKVQRDIETMIDVTWSHPFLTARAMVATFLFWDLIPSRINKQSWSYRAASEYAKNLTDEGFSIAGLRNLIMSQRALAVADHQIKHGIERPCIVIGCGCYHIGIVEDLTLTPNEIQDKIRSDPYYGLYFSPKEIGRIVFAQYDLGRLRWNKGVIKNTQAIR